MEKAAAVALSLLMLLTKIVLVVKEEKQILYSIGPFLTVILLGVTYLNLCLKLQNVIDVIC